VRIRIVLAATLVVVTIGVAYIVSERGSGPELIIDGSVAADFAAVAMEDWESFVDAFPSQRGCIGQVTLVADYDLDDLAKYDPESRTMAVRVPAPRVLLDRAVVHELAHHLEFECRSQVEMRPSFLEVLGRSDEGWFDGAEWGSVPSEIFAEAVVEYVLDERGRVHTDLGLIDQRAVDVVVDWATRS
jgi:hypothetical protein